MRKNKFFRLTLVFISLTTIIAISELVLGFTIGPQNRYCLWLPSRKAVFKPYPGVMPGVGAQAVFQTNSDGVRGDELTGRQDLRVLAVGGSTTECLYIDQQKSWPYLLQKKLASAYKQNVWVGNIGRSGLSTTANVIELKYLLPQYEKIDLIIALVGFNDLQSALLGTFVPNSRKSDEEKAEMVFVITPSKEKAKFYERSALWRLIKKSAAYLKRDKGMVEDSVGNWYIGARNARKMAKEISDDLPDLSPDLKIFEDNINAMIDLAQKRSIRIIFLTQPYLWHDHLSEAEKDLLWFGFTQNKKKYYSVSSLARGLEAFNVKLRQVCMMRNVECVDLENLIPRNTDIFYDDVHFNDNGCLKVADAVAGYLIKGNK